MTDDRNSIDGAANTLTGRDLWCKGSEVAGDAVIAPSDRKNGVCGHVWPIITTPIEKILTVTLDPSLGQPGVVEVNGERFERVPADVAGLTIKLADAEEQLAGITSDKQRAEAAYDGLRPYADKLEARVRVLTEERDTAESRAEAFRAAIIDDAGALSKLAGERDAATAARDMMQRHLADMTTNRDALVEICERKDKRILSTEIERDTARDIAALFRETLIKVRECVEFVNAREYWATLAASMQRIDAALATVPGDAEAERAVRRSRDDFIAEIHKATPNGEYVEVQHHPDGSWSVCDTPAKPRCRVVTSPRFYGDEETRRAVSELDRFIAEHEKPGLRGWPVWGGGVVDLVATALGMRRAAK